MTQKTAKPAAQAKRSTAATAAEPTKPASGALPRICNVVLTLTARLRESRGEVAELKAQLAQAHGELLALRRQLTPSRPHQLTAMMTARPARGALANVWSAARRLLTALGGWRCRVSARGVAANPDLRIGEVRVRDVSRLPAGVEVAGDLRPGRRPLSTTLTADFRLS